LGYILGDFFQTHLVALTAALVYLPLVQVFGGKVANAICQAITMNAL
jgi:hypothetical protein